MKKSIFIFLFLIICIQSCNKSAVTETKEPLGINNRAYQWGKISLECTANDTENFKPRPTVTSRILALVWTSIFDAWSLYDQAANPMFLTNVEKRPVSEHTLTNKEIAISYAAYRAMREYYFSDSILLKKYMVQFGLDPEDTSLDPTTPVGIGNLAAQKVIDARHNDGSNQLGTMPNSNGSRYSDYTGYKPVNTEDQLNDINRWQPKYFSDGKGGKFAPACLTPHWWKVNPIALDSPAQFRPIPPPMVGSKQLEAEVKEVVDLQANLTDEQRALVEFMRDGPKSVQQAGHW